jgi:CO/xanthine dehydrogenase FAD-binding subunit
VEFLQPTTLDEALAAKAGQPEALPIAGGTDVMLDLNFDRRRPELVLDLTRIDGFDDVSEQDGWLRVGAGVTYTDVIDELGDRLPALAAAARSIASPLLRNRATIAGNLGTASPGGDCHPVLIASGGEVEAVSQARGARRIAADDFFVGPGRNALEADELIAATWLPPASVSQQFAKVGRRNAMAKSVCSFALVIDADRKTVGAGIGSAGPTPLRAREAEAFLAGVYEEHGLWASDAPVPASALERFGELVAAAARPIDDVRGSADYRRHVLGVLARRTVSWTRNGGAA